MKIDFFNTSRLLKLIRQTNIYDMKKTSFLFAYIISNLFSIAALSQMNVTISGNIKSILENQPVASATVLIKGSGLGTITDDNGTFKITAYKSSLLRSYFLPSVMPAKK